MLKIDFKDSLGRGGGTAKMRSWTRVGRNCVFQSRAEGFPILDSRNKACPRCIQTGLDTSGIRVKARLRCVWKRFPRRTPLAIIPVFVACSRAGEKMRRPRQVQGGGWFHLEKKLGVQSSVFFF